MYVITTDGEVLRGQKNISVTGKIVAAVLFTAGDSDQYLELNDTMAHVIFPHSLELENSELLSLVLDSLHKYRCRIYPGRVRNALLVSLRKLCLLLERP